MSSSQFIQIKIEGIKELERSIRSLQATLEVLIAQNSSTPNKVSVSVRRRKKRSQSTREVAQYYTPKTLGAVLGVTEQELWRWREEGRGPDFVRLGRLIRYNRQQANDWMLKNWEKPELKTKEGGSLWSTPKQA